MPGGVAIPFSDAVVSLGVKLDSKLTWVPFITQVSRKVKRNFYIWRFFRACIAQTLRKRLEKLLVLPHLDYRSVLCIDTSSEQKWCIQRLRNVCIRYIFSIRHDQHITPYRDRLGWSKTDFRRTYFTVILLYSIPWIGTPG